MADKQKLKKLLDNLPEELRMMAEDTLEEYCYFLEKVNELKKLPMIRIHPDDPSRQRLTPASKLIKDFSNGLDAKRSTLIRIFTRTETSAEDELLKALSEFE